MLVDAIVDVAGILIIISYALPSSLTVAKLKRGCLLARLITIYTNVLVPYAVSEANSTVYFRKKTVAKMNIAASLQGIPKSRIPSSQ